MISNLINIEYIVKNEYSFNIPIYQRLYVWADEQIKTLLEDFYTAFKQRPEEKFYLGSVIVKENEALNYDLIDGQQRFTTLWLLSIVMKSNLEPFIFANSIDNQLRLSFSIREHVTAFFKTKLRICTSTEDISNDEPMDLENINRALELIRSFKNGSLLERQTKMSEAELGAFTKYVYQNIHFIFSTANSDMNLNKLFEVINGRGVQLQHHEILKAKFLKGFSDKENFQYGVIWNACANMNSPIEKNLKEEARYIQLNHLYTNEDARLGLEKLANPNIILELITGSAERSSSDLLSILADETLAPTADNPAYEDYDFSDSSSIISFPMLLLHTLRIYLHQRQSDDIDRFKEKELLNIFGEHFDFRNHCIDDAMQFIKLLWITRYNFDKYVIRWVKVNDVKNLSLLRLNKGDYLSRSPQESSDEFTMLQSMLYHSQEITTQFWLTPFLYKSLTLCDNTKLLKYLKKLDNVLFSTKKMDFRLKTKRVLDRNLEVEQEDFDLTPYHGARGTAFNHYLFYKLEFILWSNWRNGKLKDSLIDEAGWENYRMTSKHSIEHISSQNPRDDDSDIVDIYKHHFGNLALLTASMNSENSNKSYKIKQIEFLQNKKINRISSLKLDLVFQNSDWNDTICENHQNAMLKYIENYVKEN